MRKLKRAEILILAFTLVFAAFTGGYFTGRRSSVNIITVYPERTVNAPAEAAATPPAADNTPDVPDSPLPQQRNDESADAGDEYADTAYESDYDYAPDYAVESDIADVPPAQDDTPPADDSPPIIGAPRGGGANRMININTASRAELTDLPGIGDVIAGRIIDYRNQHGAFERIEDIMNVSGIGTVRFENMRDRITVG